VTVVWAGESGPRARHLRPGSYRLRTIRIEREHEGKHWFISSTGPAGKPRELAAGKALRIDASAEVHFEGVVRRKGKGKELQLGFSIKSAAGRGLSVYRDGKRVPVTYELLARDGKVVVSGPMTYG